MRIIKPEEPRTFFMLIDQHLVPFRIDVKSSNRYRVTNTYTAESINFLVVGDVVNYGYIAEQRCGQG